MKRHWLPGLIIAAALSAASARAGDLGPQALAQIVPGLSTEADLRALLGAPWRVVQFDDCGEAMPGEAAETWEYRGRGSEGSYRVHVEFDERGLVHLVASIPDKPGAKPTAAAVAPEMCLSM
jgi:hypothetical protein